MSAKKMMVSVMAVAVAGLVLAGCHRGEMTQERLTKMVEWKVDDFLDSVDATDEQRAKVNAISTKTVHEVGPALLENKAARTELVRLLSNPSVDVAAVHATLDKRSEVMKAAVHRLADAAIEIHAVLTPEQRAQLAEKLQKYEQRYNR